MYVITSLIDKGRFWSLLKLLKQFHCNAWVTFKYYIESSVFLVSLLHGLPKFC